jgi:hypothetical protein
LASTSNDLTTTPSYIIPPKKTTAISVVLTPLDTNQGDEALLWEARMQKRKATIPEPQYDELDRESNNLEAIHEQVEKCKEKMLRLSELQKKIDEAIEEMRNIESHENQYNYKYLRHEGCSYNNLRLEVYNFQDFMYDEASLLTPELQATPWPPVYRLHMLYNIIFKIFPSSG